jgi:hypothetical protein
MNDNLYQQLFHEFTTTDISDGSVVLSHLDDDELQHAHDAALRQFGLELVIGACEKSDWLGSKLVIDSNEGAISFFQTVFCAIELERVRRQP